MTLYPPISTLSGSLRSKALKRDVHYRLIGKEYLGLKNTLQIIFNDGQDFPALKMQSRVAEFNSRSDNCKVVVLGIDCGDRINEYGTVASADYKNRGNKAALYEQFVIRELIPEMYDRYGFGRSAGSLGYAGFSLGGLSAFDLTVRHPELFRFAGVFSGSFWWRHEPFTDDTPDDYRIMHESLETLPLDKNQLFWFEAGTKDETSDRNGNGIIDAIDDTLAIIDILERRGISRKKNITFLEVTGGTHDPFTWGAVMHHFFNWISSHY